MQKHGNSLRLSSLCARYIELLKIKLIGQARITLLRSSVCRCRKTALRSVPPGNRFVERAVYSKSHSWRSDRFEAVADGYESVKPAPAKQY
jgi:hypothetical protein